MMLRIIQYRPVRTALLLGRYGHHHKEQQTIMDGSRRVLFPPRLQPDIGDFMWVARPVGIKYGYDVLIGFNYFIAPPITWRYPFFPHSSCPLLRAIRNLHI